MPNLHELFDAASDDLPPLPDLAPTARRIVRRRKTATRCAAAALSSALVIGAGTMLIGGIQASTPSDTGIGAGSSPSSGQPIVHAKTFHEEAVSALQKIWPISGERIKYVGTPNHTVYAATTPIASYRVVLAFHRLPPNDPRNLPHMPCATDTGPQSGFTCSDLPNGQTVAARVGAGMAEFDFTTGGVYSTLTVIGGPMAQIDARKLVTMAKSPTFQQLAADAHRYFGVIRPMPGAIFSSTAPALPPNVPDTLIVTPASPDASLDSNAPAATTPAAGDGVTPPRGSDSARPPATP
jgi:hypothetical protein